MPSSRTSNGAAAVRRRTILLDTRLIGPRGDGLCRIHAMSGMEMTVQTGMDIGRGDWVRVELPNGQSVSGQVDWTAPGHIGVTFAVPIDDLDQFLAGCDGRQDGAPGGRHAAPGFFTCCPVDLWQGSTVTAATMLDMSADGARLVVERIIWPDRPLLIAIPGLPLLLAVDLRWIDGFEAGVAFAHPLSFEWLAAWLDTRGLRFSRRD